MHCTASSLSVYFAGNFLLDRGRFWMTEIGGRVKILKMLVRATFSATVVGVFSLSVC